MIHGDKNAVPRDGIVILIIIIIVIVILSEHKICLHVIHSR